MKRNDDMILCGQCANNNFGTCERTGEMVGDRDGCNLGKTKTEDVVNHPTHYTSGSVECIDAMQSAFGSDALASYCRINAFKYVWRASLKNGREDIKKAVWYLNKYLELTED